MFNFNPAAREEKHIYGSARPGFGSGSVSQKRVEEWIDFMKKQDVQNVCCLLSDAQLAFYDDLLESYKEAFGSGHVCWAPVEDFHLADEATLTQQILPFLRKAIQSDEQVVVHCSAGQGRTGHVLAAWLVYGRGMSNEAALDAVEQMGRRPYEAEGRHAEGKRKLHDLLDLCRQ